ncbi:zf-HC2 domain-containing protein [Streptomyces sp. NY05-11A]|uniref:zf-HC2 domain-containing protein n=1 Tax=Streptomyces soliscabiei TaxID=588897 RepID=UPI0029A0CC67|nr:zf-HC2 domain-containing protein [Streptomyces sp. NY05-11A]MDX2678890.1 zf-HC2 domain-containing protein [Streptomyces sp. NY05-11A]
MSGTNGFEPYDGENDEDSRNGENGEDGAKRGEDGAKRGDRANRGDAKAREETRTTEGTDEESVDTNAKGGTPAPAPPPRIPLPRASVEDSGLPLPALEEPGSPAPPPLTLEHPVLKSLLGAWALAACSAEETAAVEEHLGDCGACADEARRLREAVGLLQRPESLDLDPGLRTRVLDGCLDRRPPRIPVPAWAASYDAETARLDALLQDFGDAEWHAPVRLRWFRGDGETYRRTTVAGVIAHLLAVDGLVAVALGLDDPLDAVEKPEEREGRERRERLADGPPVTPARRTEAFWAGSHYPPTRSVRAPWREQAHALVRTVSFTGAGTSTSPGTLPVSYGGFELPLRDAMLDRAFECWVHAEDIAEAVDYPYAPPAPRHLHGMIDLAARMLPETLAARRRAGLAAPSHTRHLVPAGRPGRSLRLEIEGSGGGQWLIPLDSPGAVGSADHEVAHVALDDVEFCRLAAGHVSPEEAAAGQLGDRAAIRDVLFAAAALSRM